jgi:hypothetical protein
MITKANRDNLIKMGGTSEEIGKSTTFKNTVSNLFRFVVICGYDNLDFLTQSSLCNLTPYK